MLKSVSTMGFKSVNQCLTEMFPQVDPRILRAVALEHPKDANAAAETVVLEILPFLKAKPGNPKPLDSSKNIMVDQRITPTSEEHPAPSLEDKTKRLGKEVDDSDAQAGSSGILKVDAFDSENIPDNVKTKIDPGNNNLYREENAPLLPDVNKASENTEIHLPGEKPVHEEPPQSKDDDEANSSTLNDDAKSTDAESESESSHRDGEEENNETFDNKWFEGDQEDGLYSSWNQELPDPLIQEASEDKESEETSISSEDEDSESTEEFSDDKDDFDASSNLSDPIPLHEISGEIPLLEETLEDAKNNKKILFAAVDLVLNLMREAEEMEESAEVEEQETHESSPYSDKVEMLTEMIEKAKQANDAHAGEVYGEKSILATEARELQGRLVTLSAERDSALSALDQMRRRLEERISAAESIYKAAQFKNMERDKRTSRVLDKQEALLENLLQESKLLQSESKGNSKMREFLAEKGRVVDVLQGEISVICEDVKALKGKFDLNLPLSQSVSSSQTSCLLAASPHVHTADVDKVVDPDKDDDWELFDNSEV